MEMSSESDDDDMDNLLSFDTEEEFFAAASKCASLYFLKERRIFFEEKSLLVPGQSADGARQNGAVYRVLQRGGEQEIVQDNTGGAVYDAAIVLSRYLAAKEAGKMQGKTVLELGCGPALVAMISARLVGGAGYVCATDGDEATVKLAKQNLALIPETNTAATRFWWGTSPQDIVEMRDRNWDYILASDVAYEPAVFAPLCDALITLSHGKSKILLCNGVRSSTRERALRQLLLQHFAVEDIDVQDLAFSQEEEDEGDAIGKVLNVRRFHRHTLLWSLVRR